jgi:hypothetical protein
MVEGRKGQWVRIEKPEQLKEAHANGGKAIGIVSERGPARIQTRTGPLDVLEGFVVVDLIDAKGFTLASVVASKESLEPVVSRDDIPAPRLKTMRKDWTPSA